MADPKLMGFRGYAFPTGMPWAVELKQKAPLLLQSSQLWAVLSALSISEQGRQKGEHLRSFTNFEVKMPELPYIRGLRFSLTDLQGGGAHKHTHMVAATLLTWCPCHP